MPQRSSWLARWMDAMLIYINWLKSILYLPPQEISVHPGAGWRYSLSPRCFCWLFLKEEKPSEQKYRELCTQVKRIIVLAYSHWFSSWCWCWCLVPRTQSTPTLRGHRCCVDSPFSWRNQCTSSHHHTRLGGVQALHIKIIKHHWREHLFLWFVVTNYSVYSCQRSYLHCLSEYSHGELHEIRFWNCFTHWELQLWFVGYDFTDL